MSADAEDNSRTSATPGQVAKWMQQRLQANGVLSQQDAAWEIEQLFGIVFTYTNDNGNTAIDKGVLTAFRKLTAKDVVWESGERLWRRREVFDDPNKRKAE